MKNIKFQNTENGLVVSIIQTVKNFEPTGFEMSEYEIKRSRRAYVCDIIGAFSERLIAAIKRRMEACQNNLLNHLEDCVSHNGQVISWIRKDGTTGSFSVVSFEIMEKAVASLKKGAWWEFATNKLMVDQTIKALLNDTEQDHSDAGSFRYSELCSVLLSLLSEEKA